MKSLFFCCLFGAFLATGMCLECDHCLELGQNCSGWTRTCDPKADTCVTFQTEVIRAPFSVTFTSKTCGTSDTCDLDYVETTVPNEITVRSKRACCTGAECLTVPVPVLEPLVNRSNGLECSGCIGLTSIECAEQLVSCQGSENQCLSVIVKNSDTFSREVSWKGCASKSLCSLLEKKFWSVLGEFDLDIECTPALPHSTQCSDA